MKIKRHHYIFLHIKHHFKTYLSDIAVYSIFIMISIIAGLTGNSFAVSYAAHINETYGIYDAYLSNTTPDEYNSLLTDETLRVGSCYTLGKVNGDNQKTILLGYYDKIGKTQIPLNLTEGRLPASEGEIAIEESALYNLHVYTDEARSLTLNYTGFDGESYHKTFQIVGVLENYTYHINTDKLTQKEKDSSEMLPGILVYPDSSSVWTHHALLTIDNDPAEKLDTYKSIYGDRFFYNQNRLDYKNTGIAPSFYITFLLLILLGFICLIGNIMVQKKHHSNLTLQMKCAGATNVFCIIFRLRVSLAILLPSLTIGLLVGTAISKMIVTYILSKSVGFIIFVFSVKIPIIACAVTFFTILLLTLLAQLRICKGRPLSDNARKEVSPVKLLRVKRETFEKHPLAVWGFKSVIYNSAKYASVILSLTAMMFAVIFANTIFTQIRQKYDEILTFDYQMNSTRGSYMSSLEIAADHARGFNDSDITKLYEAGEATGCYAYSTHRFHILNPYPLYVKDTDFPFNRLIKRGGYDQNQMAAELEQYGYDANTELYTTKLRGCSEDFLDKILSDPKADFDPGNDVIFFTDAKTPYYKIGDLVQLTQPILQSDGTTKRVDLKMTISTIITPGDSAAKYFSGGTFFCISEDYLNSMGVDRGYNTMLVYLADKDVYAKTERVLEQISALHGSDSGFSYLSERMYNQEKQQVINVTYMIGGIIILIISIYSIITLYNLFRNKMYAQKKTWGSLRASGVGFAHAVWFHISEVIIINIISWCFTIGIFLSLIIFGNSDPGYVPGLFSPWLFLLVPAGSIAVCSIMVLVLISIFWKERVIDLIREL